MRPQIGSLVLGLVCGGLLALPVTGRQFAVLHTFGGADGANPSSGLILSGTTLYGVAGSGGAGGSGTVFKINVDGTGFAALCNFTGGSDGGGPTGTLALSGNTLYGVASIGGSNGNGAVFRVNIDGSGFATIYSFSAVSQSSFPYSNTDGVTPSGGLSLSGNTLYGATVNGGSAGNGTVFRVNTDGTAFTNLHNFSTEDTGTGGNYDGARPLGGVILSGFTLYGTAQNGGLATDRSFGTLFAVDTDGSGFTPLWEFSGSPDGANPAGRLVSSGSTLYGMTSYAGQGSGTVFGITAAGSPLMFYDFTPTVFPSNNNKDGDNQGYEGGLVAFGNVIYGVAGGGGTNGSGAVFQIDASGSNFTSLYAFSRTAGPSSINSDGAVPAGSLVVAANTLYGTATYGGGSGNGTIFSVAVLPPLTAAITPLRVTLPQANVSANDSINAPIVPTNDLDILASAAAPLGLGVVADGVTPVLFNITGTPGNYTIYAGNSPPGQPSVYQPVIDNLYVLQGGEWTPTTNITISADGQSQIGTAYAYLQGMDWDSLVTSLGSMNLSMSNDLQIQLNLLPVGALKSAATTSFRIRPPPIVLVHGYNADAKSWSPSFLQELQERAPEDFVVPIEYGVTYGFWGESKDINTSEALTNLTRQYLDPLLNQTFNNFASQWALTRYDAVGHSQGGVLLRMLCQTNLAGNSAFGTLPPVTARNFYRGRFRHVITIGSPHNGTTLLRYTLLRKNGFVYEGQTYKAGVFTRGVLAYIAPLLQEKFDPFGSQIQQINSPSFPPDGRIAAVEITATIYGGLAPMVGAMNLPFLYSQDDLNLLAGMGPCIPNPVYFDSIGQLVIPYGSDGVCDLDGQACGTTDYFGQNVNLAHSDNAVAGFQPFGVPPGYSETSYAGMGAETILDLAGDIWGPFVLPAVLADEERCLIDNLATNSLFQDNNVSVLGQLTPVAAVRGVAPIPHQPKPFSPLITNSCVDYTLDVPSNAPAVADVTWLVTAYTTNGTLYYGAGASTNGIYLETAGTNNSTVTVCLDASVSGTLTLQAALTASTGGTVGSQTLVIWSNIAGNLTNIALIPSPINADIGDLFAMQLYGLYDDATSAPLYVPDPTNVIWSFSEPNVFDVDTNFTGQALGPGSTIVTANYGGFSAQAIITVNSPGKAIIADQPKNQVNAPGQTATFDVIASGASPLYYQWYFDSAPLSGATNSNLVLEDVEETNVGSYYVVVSNAVSTATSASATLEIPRAVILGQPTSQVAVPGGNVNFTISVSGAAPFTYQWFFDGVAIPDDLSSNLSLSDVGTNEAGSYELVVENLYGSITSSIITLSVTNSGPAVTFNSLYSFGAVQDAYGDPLDGAFPYSALEQDNNGTLYGTTAGGGTNIDGELSGFGTVFVLSNVGYVSNLYSFGTIVDNYGNPLDGAYPHAGLTTAADGSMYGMTTGGGTNLSPDLDGFGTIFQITPEGVLTTLYSFGNLIGADGIPLDGAYPYDALIEGPDGCLYGTTFGGGANTNFSGNGFGPVFGFTPSGLPASRVPPMPHGCGTVFKLAADDTFTSLYSFGANQDTNGDLLDGGYPYSGLARGSDGTLYGTTSEGGTNMNFGTVFSICGNGSFTNLYSFGAIQDQSGDPLDGAVPYAMLLQTADGSLYGTTYGGGTNPTGYGTVFQISTNGTLKTLHSFGSIQDSDGDIADGAYPVGGLIQGNDGNFYGTTSSGGEGGNGTLFKVTPDGGFTTLYWFSGGNDGANPYGALFQATDGYYYGTTAYGGTNGDGTVFRFNIAGPPPPPSFQSIVQNSGVLTFTWTTVQGLTYQVQCTTNLSQPSWTNLGSPILAGGSTLSTSDVITNSQQFYRVVLLP